MKKRFLIAFTLGLSIVPASFGADRPPAESLEQAEARLRYAYRDF